MPPRWVDVDVGVDISVYVDGDVDIGVDVNVGVNVDVNIDVEEANKCPPHPTIQIGRTSSISLPRHTDLCL